MSLRITTDIECDGADCINMVHGVVDDVARSGDARKEARKLGWLYIRINNRYIDLCPKCVETYRIPVFRRR